VSSSIRTHSAWGNRGLLDLKKEYANLRNRDKPQNLQSFPTCSAILPFCQTHHEVHNPCTITLLILPLSVFALISFRLRGSQHFAQHGKFICFWMRTCSLSSGRSNFDCLATEVFAWTGCCLSGWGSLRSNIFKGACEQ
jgi:hypothetical protein